MAGQSSLDPNANATRWPLTLPSVCENSCTPRWKPPWRAATQNLPIVFFVASAFPVLFAVVGLVLGFADSEVGPVVGLVIFFGSLLLALLVALPGWLIVRRPYRARRHISAGERMPVSVYYARTNEYNPTVARQRTEIRRQPMLLLVAPDGRMWTATPDITSFHTASSHGYGGSTYLPGGISHYRNNPWIAPLYALEGQNRLPVFDQDTLADRPLPVDLQAPAQERVLAALATLGQGRNNDPRFVGGPVPGELLAPQSESSYVAPYTRQRLTGGLVLHRPADAPAQASLAGHGWIEHLFFGTDPGLCHGFYLTDLTPPHASG